MSLVSLQLFIITLFAKDVIWEITAECSIKFMKFSSYNFQNLIHSLRKGNKNWQIKILNILTKRLQWEGSETTSVNRVKTLILLDVPYKKRNNTKYFKHSKAIICGNFHPVRHKKKTVSCSYSCLYWFSKVCSCTSLFYIDL